MTLTISSLFAEAGAFFEISHKVRLFIRALLIEKVMNPYALDKKDPDVFLGLCVTTSSKTLDAEIRGPDYDRANNVVTWALWLPYKEIAEADDQLPPYIEHFFQTASQVFEHYGVVPEDVLVLQETVEKEVLGNPDYVFAEEKTPVPDLTDILQEIEKE